VAVAVFNAQYNVFDRARSDVFDDGHEDARNGGRN
jgi:hypothetical protein